MHGYRFRTTALDGPWRDSKDEALADDVRAQQVRTEDGERRWRVRREIEESAIVPSRP